MKTRLLKILRFIAKHKVNAEIIEITESGIRAEFNHIEYRPSGSFGAATSRVTGTLKDVKRAYQRAIHYSMGSLILYLRARRKRKWQKIQRKSIMKLLGL
jgi:hypothetical protein